MDKVSLRNVWKIYPGAKTTAPAVRDFNLDIAEGEFMVFVGASGCGKTTTLRMIAGLESISKGEILIDGKVVNNLSPPPAQHRHGVPELCALSQPEPV